MPASSSSGLKVLLMTDLVGSVSLQERLGLEAYSALKDQHDALVQAVVQQAPSGRILEHTGDGFFLVFDNVKEAVETALRLQHRLHEGKWSPVRPQVRIGLHLGEVTPAIDHATGAPRYAGINVSLTARIMDRAGGDQILLSRPVYENARGAVRAYPVTPPTPPPTLRWQAHGRYLLKGMDEPVELFEVGGEGLASWATPAAGEARSPRRLLGRLLSSGAIAVAVAGLAGLYFLGRPPASTTPAPPAPPVAAPLPASAPPTVAVLPFSNFDGAENSSFAAGMHDDLITSLAKLSELRVISRTSVQAYADTRQNLRQIGAELGASHLVEGSVRRADNRVRITVQLIEAATDRHLWAENYDRELEDVFALQSEISTRIATSLLAQLSPAEAAKLETPPTTNLAAYDAYNRARELWRNRTDPGVALPQIAAQLQEALRLDPDFDAAGALLTELYSDWAGEGSEGSPGEAARFTIGQIKRFAPVLQRAIAEGLEEAPGDASAQLAEATRRAREGAFEAAADALLEASALDPGNRALLLDSVSRLSALGQHGKAVAALERWRENHPDDAAALLALHLARAQLDPGPAHRQSLQAWIEDRSRTAQVIAPAQIHLVAALLADPALGFDLFDRLSFAASAPQPATDRGLMFFGLWAGQPERARAAARRVLDAGPPAPADPFARLGEVTARRLLGETVDPVAIAEAAEAELAASADPFHRLTAFPFLVALWSQADTTRAVELFLDAPPPAPGSDHLPALALRAPFMPAVFEDPNVAAHLAGHPAWEALVASLLRHYPALP